MKIQRLFIPGSEWLYLKLYLGQQISDTILVNNVAPLLRQLREKQIVEKFFFIRYIDMNFHLRIRLKLFKADDVGYVIEQIYKEFIQLMETGLVWNFQYGSYQRELERYGETTMELAESIFFEDSEIVLNILKRAENKIRVSWLVVDRYLSFVYPSIQGRQLFCKEMSKSYLREFGLDNSYGLRQFNQKYRTYKDWMISTLDSHNDQYHQLIGECECRLSELFVQVRARLEDDGSLVSMKNFTASIIHMFLNRLCISDSRLFELACYYLLEKYYLSCIYRSETNKIE